MLEQLIAELGRWKKKFPELTINSLSKTDFADIYLPDDANL